MIAVARFAALALVFVLIARVSLSQESDAGPVGAIELRPGVYAACDASALPLPTCGYDLYVVGEIHGSNEVVGFFLDYLERLRESISLRDVALEASPAFERGVNEFVAGVAPTLPDLWYWELAGADTLSLLHGIRAVNETLPEDERIRVHLIDLDYGYEAIRRHVLAVRDGLGTAADAIEIPSLTDFERLSEGEMLDLVACLELVASEQEGALDELQGLRDSVRFRFVRGAVSRWEEAANECTAVRDGAIARNVLRLRDRWEGAPMLVLFGGAHVQEERILTGVVVGFRTVAIDEPYWVERLTGSGVDVFSLLICGLSGSVFSHDVLVRVAVDPDELLFADGGTLRELLADLPEGGLVYVDLQDGANALVTFGARFSPQTARFDPEKPAGEAFDGIVLFERLTPAR